VTIAAGLDLEQWEQTRQSPEVRLKVQDDVRLGLQLGIIGTPTVFLNGRIIADPSVFVLTTQTQDWFESLGFREAYVDELPPAKKATYDQKRKSEIYILDISSER